MLVDDKLAKEKLAQLAFDQQSDSTGYGESHTDGWNSACVQIAMLIRNTDLTDCQQPMEDCSVTQAQVPPSLGSSGTHQRLVWLIEKGSPAKWLRGCWLKSRDGLSEYAVVPLCWDHHQGPNGVHGLRRRVFEMRYRLTDVDMLAMVAKELA